MVATKCLVVKEMRESKTENVGQLLLALKKMARAELFSKVENFMALQGREWIKAP